MGRAQKIHRAFGFGARLLLIVLPKPGNLRDGVGFRRPASSFRRQVDEAGQSKDANDVSLSTF
jgi:hypothetical protein